LTIPLKSRAVSTAFFDLRQVSECVSLADNFSREVSINYYGDKMVKKVDKPVKMLYNKF
jgi:hypothetical protein